MTVAVGHTSPYSGSWYPDDPEELGKLLTRVFSASERRTGRGLLPGGRCFVVPHAGYSYSGTVAAAAFRHLALLKPERVFIVGFPHRGGPPGLWIPMVESISTPLGAVAVDVDAVEHLVGHPDFRRMHESRLCDHSVELQIPFVQWVAPGARVVPIYAAGLSPTVRESGADRLAALLGRNDAVLASSDFTHYGHVFSFEPFPADASAPDRLRRLDHSVIDAAGSLDPDLFHSLISHTSATVCGVEPIAYLLSVLQRIESEDELFQQTLDYQTSGEITDDFTHSVSYASLGYFPASSFLLDSRDQALVIESAQRTLDHLVETGKPVPFPPRDDSPALDRKAGVFVSLHRDGELRGCVGQVEARETISELVPDMTIAAALTDSRFAPVHKGDTGLEVDISVLTPMKRIARRERYREGCHGLALKARGRHGLLLPQVAAERNWDAPTFFEALAGKTGVPVPALDEPEAELSVFRAQLIH